jgi:ABC-type transport system involved in multi-copper enzyme maturation permease subunit
MSLQNPYDLIYNHIRNINIMTDAFYFLASIYAFSVYVLTGNKSLFILFLLYLFAGVVSITHHQATHNDLYKYDTITAGLGIAFSILITTIAIIEKKVNMLFYTLTFILLGCSFINYYYSQKYNKHLKTYKKDTIEYKYYAIMKYLHHTLWHILSGVCACSVPLVLYYTI